MGEAAAYRGGGTTMIAGYNIVSRLGKGRSVVAYMAAEWEDRVELPYQDKRMVILQLGERIIAGIYGDSKAERKKYRKWLKKVRRRVDRSEGVIMGDRKAHHKI